MNEMNKVAPLYVTPDAPIAVEGAPETGNRFVALIAGLGTALLGAIVWSVITVETGLHLGFLAIGLGLLIILVVRRLGAGSTRAFGTIGAFCALVGCFLGTLFTACGTFAAAHGRSTVLIIAQVMDDPHMGLQLMQATLKPRDLIFYAIAILGAYKLSRRPRW